MTSIEFHVNVPDKLVYGCRLLRKVYRTGARCVATAEEALLGDLDQLLWSFSPTEFLPHCMAVPDRPGLAFTPVLLAENIDPCPAESVLINLGQKSPAGFERFQRFIEVVSVQEADRLAGLARWKHYREKGYALQKHDLLEKREAA